MERREFLTVTGLALVSSRTESVYRPTVLPSYRQSPTLGPEVFAKRIERLQAELKTRKLEMFVAEPSTNFQYFTGYNPGRSERLILLMVPLSGAPVLICPSFEIERMKRNAAVSDVRGWEEHQNPWKLVKKAGQEMKPAHRNGSVAVEQSTSYQSFLNLEDQLGGWKFNSAAPVTER
ncbi:MAG TPA: aminopeptidase P family N-terminal domain-containing protein, partial [Gemmatimonadales bacterium]|nr:aminopeptidase P family N-terminal domain-containing protein [Gemmatimonadales bacterium]